MMGGYMVIRFGLVCLFVVFSFSQVGFQSQTKKETVDGVLAVVEQEVVLKSDVMQQAYLLAQERGVDPFKSPTVFENIYINTANQMVDNLVLYQLSLKDTNIFVDNLVVEESLKREIQKRIDFAGSVDQLEVLFGEPLSMIRAKLRLEIKKGLRIEQFTGQLYRETSPSVLDVKHFYNTYKDSLPLLEDRVSFAVFEWPVVLGQKKELEVVSFLTSIKDSVVSGLCSFSDMAKIYSDDVGSASSGGQLGFVVRGSLFPEYESVAFGLGLGEVSDPFKTAVGYHIVLLEDRLGEKIKTSHILKRVESDEKDVQESLKNFELFLGEYDVYNSVDTFDSLCSHFKVLDRFGEPKKTKMHGLYKNINLSSLPGRFTDASQTDSSGFHPLVVEDNNVYLARLFDFREGGFVTLENSYTELYNLTQNKLMQDKIANLINKSSEDLYIKKFY